MICVLVLNRPHDIQTFYDLTEHYMLVVQPWSLQYKSRILDPSD